MNLNDFNSSKYLGKNDVPASGLNLTLAGFGIEEMKKDGEKKPYCTFVQVGIKPLLLNKSNRTRLEAIFGTDDTGAMIGRQVNVFNDPMVEFGGQVVGGLRIRPVANTPAPVTNPATLSQSERELQDALALVRQRAQDAQRGGPASPVDPNDEIPF
jgi:hypothetical protein